MLLAYDAVGNVVATLAYVVAKDDAGRVVGLVDFAAHEDAGGRLRDAWEADGAAGSVHWPEWLGGRAHDFKVELEFAPGGARARARALVHKTSGFRRERVAIEAAIAARVAQANAAREALAAAGRSDVRVMPYVADLVGGPNRPLLLDEDGRTRVRVRNERAALPVKKGGVIGNGR